MYETNQEMKRLLERKLREVVDKGDMSPSELCCVKDAYEALYYMTAADAMSYSEEDSFRNGGRSMGMNSMREWEESMRRGRGADGRFRSMEGSFGNGGGGQSQRSYHSVNDRIIANLEKELDYAESEFERKKIMDEIRRLREMKD